MRKRLKEERERKFLSQDKIAKLIGIARKNYWCLENGRTEVGRLETWEKLEKILEVPAKELMVNSVKKKRK